MKMVSARKEASVLCSECIATVGWTAIMIYDGALAANGVVRTGRWAWCLVIGILIILWIAIGITNLGKVNALP